METSSQNAVLPLLLSPTTSLFCSINEISRSNWDLLVVFLLSYNMYHTRLETIWRDLHVISLTYSHIHWNHYTSCFNKCSTATSQQNGCSGLAIPLTNTPKYFVVLIRGSTNTKPIRMEQSTTVWNGMVKWHCFVFLGNFQHELCTVGDFMRLDQNSKRSILKYQKLTKNV